MSASTATHIYILWVNQSFHLSRTHGRSYCVTIEILFCRTLEHLERASIEELERLDILKGHAIVLKRAMHLDVIPVSSSEDYSPHDYDSDSEVRR